jgi:predicted nucleotidyltransferase
MISPTLDRSIDLPVDEIATICRRYQVRELSVFSIFEDDSRPGPPIDFLVEFEPEAQISLLDLAGLRLDLEDLLGRPVTVTTKRGLRPELRQPVLDSARVLYAA